MRDEEGAILMEVGKQLLLSKDVGCCLADLQVGGLESRWRGTRGGYTVIEKSSRATEYQPSTNLPELHKSSTASTLCVLVHILGHSPPLTIFNALEDPLTYLCFEHCTDSPPRYDDDAPQPSFNTAAYGIRQAIQTP
jgi:hypothetical protein